LVTDTVDTRSAWLSAEDIATARARLPVIYVEAVPVRVDSRGRVSHVGLLLRQMPDGAISRAIVSGRVMLGEQIRDALIRNLEKDLGPVALPRIPPCPAPFTVAEYFPDVTISGFHDPRQHAVSLVFLVPVDGDCQPSQNTLDLAWLTPAEALRDDVRNELASGHSRLVRMALAHAGLVD
jgi:ADP-ribose pyrophosphatase YjhB (NUDIX family)